MILRNCLVFFSIGLSLVFGVDGIDNERWSRQTTNSEWIPLARPRSQQPQIQTPAATNQVQLPALQSSIQSLNLPPALRQEYQQQLMQLQKTQESISKILLLQQQVRAQQQLLQNQAYLPNVVGPDEERQQFRPNPNSRPFNGVNQEALTSPQLSSDALPSIYQAQQFKSHSDQEGQQEVPAGSSSTEEKGENSDEEIQVVYVPAETLAQRGQSKEERNRDHKQHQQQFSIPRQQQQQQQLPQRYQVDQVSGVTGSGEDGTYHSEIVQFPRGPEADQFFKDARQKELDRLNEERKEIQKQAKIQQAARLREQERARQREAENKLKELAKIEELAKQRELERIRESRERARLEELERARERAAKLKEEQARQAEIERLAALERQKNAEIEQALIRQKELERLAREQEEARAKELAAKKQQIHETNEENHHHQHSQESSKHKNSRLRKTRPRVHHKPTEEYNPNQESSTMPPPNQPPLAVYMGPDLEAQEVKVVDVLRVLKDAKTIAVVDQVSTETPRVFVGPSNLGTPQGYSKFDLPYLSSLDTNRVERRVDKLPFFVAPLSFIPPPGYSKIPFPPPHIGSVIVNNLDDVNSDKPAPNPLIEPNSFIPPTGQGSTYQTPYDTPTAAPYSPYTQEVTPQYQSSVYPTTRDDDRYTKYRQQQQQYEQTASPNLENQETPSISPYQEEVTATPRPADYSQQGYLEQVTPEGGYQRPNVVSQFSYNQNPISTTPVYQDSYSHTRNQPNKEQELTSQLAQLNQHDFSQHRHAENPYLHPSQQSGLSHNHHLYHLSPNVQNSYEDPSQIPVGPTQYNLPAELPPIHPQLPGLVNSLLDPKEIDKASATTTTTTPEPTTIVTTTETPTTPYRARIRQRGRITSRPTTTTTTSAPGVTRSYERTRRPFNRSRSRYTTSTTEEYRDTSSSGSYEPTKAKVPDTTQRYSNQEQYRRPTLPKMPKLKTRPSAERNTYETTTLNQVQNPETLSDEGNLSEDPNNFRQSTYSHYNVPLTTESPAAYLQHEGSVETSVNSFSTERDYSKNPNYPEKVSVNSEISHQQQQQQQQYQQERYQTPIGGYTASLDSHSSSGSYEYDSRDGIRDSTPAILSSPGDYNYYQDKSENEPGVQTTAPVYSQILEYRPGTRPELVGQSQEASVGGVEDGQGYNQYTENQQKTHETAVPERQIETTTELPSTKTPSPVILRQRVRARLGGRPRQQDSTIQTQPRGPQEEYVRFSAVNSPSRTSSSSTTTTSGGSGSGSRVRDSTRPRPKTRPNYYNQAQVQSEGNEYVRIQSANRAYPKTIVQAAAPRTTTTTTTTAIPLLTTTEDSSSQEEEEYGFIRPPSFNSQPHHQISSKFRAQDSQIQLQNVGPADETAEDSSPTHTHTHIPKHRQKYQSPNRPRPTIKSSIITTTPSSISETPSFTVKPRVRPEEPKNRLRTRGRRPARRRTTTTTTTTTEYSLEANNNLPLEENYPKIPIGPTEASIERHSIYDSNYDTLPPNSASLSGPSRSDYVDESYPSQEFMLNFGASSLIEEQQDQSHHPGHSYHSNSGHRHGYSGSRLRPYSNQAVAPERDIYGSESQWSTKLTKSSFQPINRLNQDDDKIRKEKEYESEGKGGAAPEIITAQPEEMMAAVLVTSANETNITKADESSDVTDAPLVMTTESANFGMKMSAVEINKQSSGGENGESSMDNVPQIRRKPGRRRRIRVRVRPLAHQQQQHQSQEDFVTAESQHFNSAVNNLVQDRVKSTISDYSSTELMRKVVERTTERQQPSSSSPTNTESWNGDESITPTDSTTINYTEIPEHSSSGKEQLDVSTLRPMNNEQSVEQEVTVDEKMATTMENSETPLDITTPSAPTTVRIPSKSWNSLKVYNEWLKKKMEKTLLAADMELKKADKEPKNPEDKRTRNETSENLHYETEVSHPKNHRSEWSEVRYPSERNIYGYGRSEKVTPTTQVPGLVTKSSDSSVKTLSDYVQAIFDSMKTADEEPAILDNGSSLWTDDSKPTTTEASTSPAPSSKPSELPESSSFSAIMGLKRSGVKEEDNDFKEADKGNVSSSSSKQEEDNGNRVSEVPETPTESSSLKEETTTLLQTTSEASTSDSSIPTTTLASTSTTTEPTTTSATTTTTTTTKDPSLLGAIVRTSTSTKVSHMTEICYRGRCVMTKPKKDLHSR